VAYLVSGHVDTALRPKIHANKEKWRADSNFQVHKFFPKVGPMLSTFGVDVVQTETASSASCTPYRAEPNGNIACH